MAELKGARGRRRKLLLTCDELSQSQFQPLNANSFCCRPMWFVIYAMPNEEVRQRIGACSYTGMKSGALAQSQAVSNINTTFFPYRGLLKRSTCAGERDHGRIAFCKNVLPRTRNLSSKTCVQCVRNELQGPFCFGWGTSSQKRQLVRPLDETATNFLARVCSTTMVEPNQARSVSIFAQVLSRPVRLVRAFWRLPVQCFLLSSLSTP